MIQLPCYAFDIVGMFLSICADKPPHKRMGEGCGNGKSSEALEPTYATLAKYTCTFIDLRSNKIPIYNGTVQQPCSASVRQVCVILHENDKQPNSKAILQRKCQRKVDLIANRLQSFDFPLLILVSLHGG